MKKLNFQTIVIINVILLLLVSQIGYCKKNNNATDFIKEHLSELTHKMIIEVLIEARENTEYPMRLKKEIKHVLDLWFKGVSIDKKGIRLKILTDLDGLYEVYLEGWSGNEEVQKTATLYFIALSLLSDENGASHYMDIARNFYNDIYSYDNKHFYMYLFDSYFVLKMTNLFIECERDDFEEEGSLNGIKFYLKELGEFILEFEYNNQLFWKYKRQLEHIIKECTKVDYQLQPGDTYWSLARYVREKSGLPARALKDETLISKLALGIDQDLQNKGISRLKEGEQIELYDEGYYISILIDEESLE